MRGRDKSIEDLDRVQESEIAEFEEGMLVPVAGGRHPRGTVVTEIQSVSWRMPEKITLHLGGEREAILDRDMSEYEELEESHIIPDE